MEFVIKQFYELTLDELYKILKVRTSIFVVEQNCPYQELDDLDQNSYHIYLEEDNQIIAYARVIPKDNPFHEVSIGRVLVTKRRHGYGTKIVQKAIEVAIEKYHAEKIVIEAQTYVKKMYENVGFKQISMPFLEDGIEHINMVYERV
mgnify:FL=1